MGLRGPKKGVRGPEKPITKRLKTEQKAIEMMLQGVDNNSAIARSIKMSDKYVAKVRERWTKVFKELENVDDYRNIKKDLLSATEFSLLKNLNSKEKLKKASLNNVAYAFGQIHQASRLESGQATSITQSQNFSLSARMDLADFRVCQDIGKAEIVEPGRFTEVSNSNENNTSREVSGNSEVEAPDSRPSKLDSDL